MSEHPEPATEAFQTDKAFRVGGVILLVSVLAQRVLALIEMIGITGQVPGLDKTGLTIFQVQPVEPIAAAIGATMIALSLRGERSGRGSTRSTLWMAVALGAWMVLSGLVVLFQGIRLDGHVQVPLQGSANGISRAALTLRLTSQTVAPGLATMVIALLSLKGDSQGSA